MKSNAEFIENLSKMTAELRVAKSSELSQETSNGIDGIIATEKINSIEVIDQPTSSDVQNFLVLKQEQMPEPKTPSALEQLAKNLDEMSNYKILLNIVNPNDIIAFKVFTPSFELSEYIIGMVESFEKTNAINEGDFELTLLIMGKYFSYL